MSRLFALAVWLALGAGPALAADPAPTKKPALPDLLKQDVELGDRNIADATLIELLQDLYKRYEIPFVVMEEQFKTAGAPNIKERKAGFVLVKGKGMSLRRFLTIYLAGADATFIVREEFIEVVPLPTAVPPKADKPVVSLVVKEKPFNEVIDKLAEQYDLNVVIAPQSGDARTGFVTARLKNVPPEIALELLAVQCDLRVVRKGNAYLISSRDHVNELFGERLEKQRQQIEVEKLREAPAAAPVPAPVPEPPKPEPKP